MSEPTIASALRAIPLTVVWVTVFFIVAVFGYGLTPWDAIAQIVESQGLGETEAALIGFAAGFTLPLCVAASLLFYLLLTGEASKHEARTTLGAVGGVLFLAGWLSSELGLSAYKLARPIAAPGYV